MKNGNRLVLQPRDLVVLQNLGHLRILSRDQIGNVAGFNSVTRTNVRLNRIRSAGLIARYFVASTTGSRASIYGLTRKGAATVQMPFVPLNWRPEAVVIGNAFAAHQLAINEVYVSAMSQKPVQEVSWRSLLEPLSKNSKIIPDSLIEFFQYEKWRSWFLEVDLGTEALPRWTRKVQQYLSLALTAGFREIIRADRFAVLVVTVDESRMQSLRRHVARQTEKLFWFTTLETIKGHGFWSPIWRRPSGDQQVPPGA